MTPWLTIVTVVKDDPEAFATTLQSILGQTETGIEILVVDSSMHRVVVDQEIVQYFWTPPAGIYPAMNFAVDKARGDYIYFLNAGDTLANSGILTRVKNAIDSEPVWAYGLIEIHDPRSNTCVVSSDFDYQDERRHFFARGKFPPHQATFVRTETLKDLGGFNERFSITADYAAMLALSAAHEPVYIPEVIARFTLGGVSDTDWALASQQFHEARESIFTLSGRDKLSEKFWTTYFRTKTRIYRASRRARR